MTETITAEVAEYPVTWETLPANYELPDDPVDDLKHLTLVDGLTEAIDAAGLITESTIIASNFGICVRVAGSIVLKAPDWVYIANANPLPPRRNLRSYTPHAEGDVPAVVMEFLSDRDNGEYSARPNSPYGKWWFYERIVKVPRYVIFDPPTGRLEVYQLQSGHYSPQIPDNNGLYWIPGVNLFLGVWEGTKGQRNGYWLRWWNREGNILPWWSEKSTQEQLRIEQERQRADAAEERAARLLERLRRAGVSEEELRAIDPNNLS